MKVQESQQCGCLVAVERWLDASTDRVRKFRQMQDVTGNVTGNVSETFHPFSVRLYAVCTGIGHELSLVPIARFQRFRVHELDALQALNRSRLNEVRDPEIAARIEGRLERLGLSAAEVDRLARSDGLTGLSNRHEFDAVALDRILQATSGRVDIKLFPANQLGSDTDLLTQVRNGSVDFFNLSSLILATFVPVSAEISSSGNGTSMHVELESLKERLGLDIIHVPYKDRKSVV